MKEIRITTARRGGKTTALMQMAGDILKREPGSRVLVVSNTKWEQDLLVERFKENKIYGPKQLVRHVTSPSVSMSFRNGSQIDFRVHANESVHGRYVDYTMIDNIEAFKKQDLIERYYPCTTNSFIFTETTR